MINEIKKEIDNQIKDLEKDYGMSYDDMYSCYIKNSTRDYHVGVSYIEGMRRVVRITYGGNK
tara:strand:- start:107 stop:292 length:186 start_codon:yes stop_codon:yes gene_type:complete